MDYEIFEFSNGIRLIHKQVPNSNVTHCGYIIDAGSRDEELADQGVAHFIEHMLFKGTKKRKSFHILSRLEGVGGELNAYTTKEKTCIYASCLKEHLGRALELLTDITFNSNFPAKELEKEKKVVLEELDMYRDSPEDSIYDDFQELVYKGHSLGYNILGTEETIEQFNGRQIQQFIDHTYATSRIVLATVGALPFKKVLRMVEKHLKDIPERSSQHQRKSFTPYKPFHKKMEMSFIQSHAVIGNLAYNLKHKDRPALSLLNNYLGGPALNSRLNLAIRERYGLTYNIESGYSAYQDSGLMSIQIGTDARYLEKSVQLIEKELKQLRDKKLSSLRLKQAKQQFIGQIAIAEENRASLMLALGKSILDFGQPDTLAELFGKIEQVTAEQLQEIAQEIFDPQQLSYLFYIGKNGSNHFAA